MQTRSVTAVALMAVALLFGSSLLVSAQSMQGTGSATSTAASSAALTTATTSPPMSISITKSGEATISGVLSGAQAANGDTPGHITVSTWGTDHDAVISPTTRILRGDGVSTQLDLFRTGDAVAVIGTLAPGTSATSTAPIHATTVRDTSLSLRSPSGTIRDLNSAARMFTVLIGKEALTIQANDATKITAPNGGVHFNDLANGMKFSATGVMNKHLGTLFASSITAREAATATPNTGATNAAP